MLKLCGAYSRYYNSKYKRTGALFESNFKAEHLGNDQYVKYIFSYIHLNPIKLIQSDWRDKGIKSFPKTKKYLQEYLYSSYRDYLDLNNTKSYKVLSKDVFKNIIPKETDLNDDLLSWLNFRQE